MLEGFWPADGSHLAIFPPLRASKQKHSLTEHYGFELGLSLLLYIMGKMLRNSPYLRGQRKLYYKDALFAVKAPGG